jgi:hypothetical protein
MAFSFIVEVLNMFMIKKQNRKVVRLDEPEYPQEKSNGGDQAK